MTGEEMERAIEFLLQHQATLEERVTELSRVVQMQADSQSQLNQTLATAITTLAEAQLKTEAKVNQLAEQGAQTNARIEQLVEQSTQANVRIDRLAEVVERLIEGRNGQG